MDDEAKHVSIYHRNDYKVGWGLEDISQGCGEYGIDALVHVLEEADSAYYTTSARPQWSSRDVVAFLFVFFLKVVEITESRSRDWTCGGLLYGIAQR